MKTNTSKTIVCIITFFLIWILGNFLLYDKYSLYVDILENIKWSHHLAILYGVHPGLGALFLKVMLWFIPNPLLAGLVASAICMLTSIIFLYKILDLFFDKNTALFLIILSLLSSVFGDYSFVQYNQNVILLPFWIMTCYYFIIATQKNLLRYWIMLAVSCALGMYSKFEIGLLIIILFIFLLPKLKKEMLSKVITSAVLFFILLLPLFYSLVESHFGAIRYANGEMSDFSNQSISLLSQILTAQLFNLSSLGYVAAPIVFIIFLSIKGQVSFAHNQKFVSKLLNPLVVCGIYPLIFFYILQTCFMHLEYGWLMVIMSTTLPATFYLFEIKINSKVFEKIVMYFIVIEVVIFAAYNAFIYFGPTITTRNFGNNVALKAQIFLDKNTPNGNISYVIGYHPKRNQMSLSAGAFLKSKPDVFPYESLFEPLSDHSKIPYDKPIMAIFPSCNKDNTAALVKNNFQIKAQGCSSFMTINKFKNKNQYISYYLVFRKKY
ncbi:glycosyltransferase family 39 protein [Francisellaceae bacterium CB299]|jgi:4-amino-4-deoxy-L-arabinose transferase-like glycosyltransferase